MSINIRAYMYMYIYIWLLIIINNLASPLIKLNLISITLRLNIMKGHLSLHGPWPRLFVGAGVTLLMNKICAKILQNTNFFASFAISLSLSPSLSVMSPTLFLLLLLIAVDMGISGFHPRIY